MAIVYSHFKLVYTTQKKDFFIYAGEEESYVSTFT